jgi:molybdopterin molybdotransferase
MKAGLTVAALHRLIDERVRPLAAQKVALREARGLLLAEAALADADTPSCDLSAMDGYAIAKDAALGTFQLAGTILPGQAPLPTPPLDGALKVFTGSSLPEGVKVIMQEDVLRDGDKIKVTSLHRSGHVRRRGSTAQAGDVLLPKGTILSAAEIAILASIGITTPPVIPRVRVAHLTTGSEVVPTENTPKAGQVRNTNAPLIQALVAESGALYSAHRHTDESLAAGLEICRTPAFEESDLLLISGGSSGGDHDHTAELMESLGFELCSRLVRCRPGKPFLFGLKGNKVAVGLPGNPVSHFVSFHLFVRRILQQLKGQPVSRLIKGILSSGAQLQEGALETYWPAEWKYTAQEAHVSAMPWLHSGHLSALAGVNALIRVSASEPPPKAGETVEFLSCGTSAMT